MGRKRTINTGRVDSLGRPIKVAPKNDNSSHSKAQGILSGGHDDGTPYYSDVEGMEVVNGKIIGENEMYNEFNQDGMTTYVSTSSMHMFDNFIAAEKRKGNDIKHEEWSYENFQNNNFRLIQDFMEDEFGVDNVRFNSYDFQSINTVPAEELDSSRTCKQLSEECVDDTMTTLMNSNVGERFSDWARRKGKSNSIIVL